METAKKTAERTATKKALAEKQAELVIREGDAAKIYEERILEISGTIEAPRKFLEKRKKDHEIQDAHVVFNREKMQIVFTLDEREHFKTTITGTLIKNPDLEVYGINKGKEFTILDLQKFLKLRRSHFTDREKNLLIVTNLGKFKAHVSTELEQNKDTRGNEKNLKETKITTELALDFDLSIPIFKGGENKKFKVEICFDVRDAAVSVWLESPELQEIIDGDRDGILNTELEAFKEYVIIEQ